MNRYIEQLKRHLAEEPLVDGPCDIHTLLEMLYCYYAGSNAVDSEQVQACIQKIEGYVCNLSFDKKEDISTCLISMCAAQERAAFIDGLRVGAQMVLELTGEEFMAHPIP